MNTQLTLVPSNAKVLRRKADLAVAFPDWLPREMVLLMIQKGGCGLAAPQVDYSLRLFVTYWGDVFVNPVITEHSDNTTTALEGCLSLPGVSVAVPRYDWIKVHGRLYYDIAARIIQHEMDHLDGKLITDYLQPSGNPAGRVGT